MNVKLYLNGLYWKDVEVKGGEFFDVLVDQGMMFEYEPGLADPKNVTMHKARFRIVAISYDGLGETYFGICVDPKLYIGRNGVQCHNTQAFLNAARELGLNVS